jgi:hypothetical protein
MGKRGPETERSPVGAAVVVLMGAPRCEVTRSACRRSDRAWRVRAGGRWRRGDACSGNRGGPGLALRAKLLTVGEAHQVVVPRSMKVQAPEPDFEPGGEGV